MQWLHDPNHSDVDNQNMWVVKVVDILGTQTIIDEHETNSLIKNIGASVTLRRVNDLELL
jgi:hypothetical protein